MNKLDDFLKSKIDQASFDTPSSWDALETALSVQTSRRIAKWVFASVLLGGIITSVILLKSRDGSVFVSNKKEAVVNVSTDAGKVPTKVSSAITTVETREESKPSIAVQKVIPVISTSLPISDASSLSKNDNINVTNIPTTPIAPSEKGEPVNSAAAIEESRDTKEPNRKEMVAEEKTVISEQVKKEAKPGELKRVTVRKASRNDFHNGSLYATFSFSSIFSYRSFQLNNGAAPFVNKNYESIRQNSEVMNLGYGGSFALEYKFSRSFSLQAGASYNKIGYKSKYNFEITEKAETDNTGRIIGYDNLSTPTIISSTTTTKIEVLRIPLGFNFNVFLNPSMLFHFYVGGSHNVILAASGIGLNRLTLAEQKINKDDFMKTAKEVCLNLGVNIALSPKYGCGVDLYYNKWLTNISKNKLENVTPFSPGVNFAISRKLF